MSIKIKSAGSRNIEDYVLSCSRIPFSANRNRDETAIIGEFSMIVSASCPAEYRTEGVAISVSGVTYDQFTGEIIKAEYNTDNRTYKLLIRDLLHKLKLYTIDTATLETAIEGLGSYENDDDWHYSHASMVDIIEEMFSIAGLSFTFPTESAVYTSIVYSGTPRDIQYNHIYIDEKMLWGINQSFAGHNNYYQGSDTTPNRVTFWEFINACLTTFNLEIFLPSDGSAVKYNLRPIPSASTIADDNIYKQTETKVLGSGEGYTVDHRINADRERFRQIAWEKASLTTKNFSGGNKKNSLPVYSNLIFLYAKWWDGFSPLNVIWGQNDDAGAYKSGYCVSGYTMGLNKIGASEEDWTSLNRRSILAEKDGGFRKNSYMVESQSIETVYETEGV